jgi:hypothetical protein
MLTLPPTDRASPILAQEAVGQVKEIERIDNQIECRLRLSAPGGVEEADR